MRRLLYIGYGQLFASRQFLRGLTADHDFMQRWQIRARSQGMDEPTWRRLLAHFPADALILHGASPARLAQAARLPVPVYAFGLQTRPVVPGLMVDHEAVGRMAADYFLAHNFSAYAFLGHAQSVGVDLRLQGFRERLRRRGFRPLSLILERVKNPLDLHDDLVPSVGPLDGWLRRLPAPCAVFAVDDLTGVLAVEACQRLGLPVPRAVAVLGAQDDNLLCQLTYPRLSSISLPFVEMGRAAARWIDAAPAAGRRGAVQVRRFPPVHVAERGSTATGESQDPLVLRALALIDAHLGTGVRVDQLCRACGVSATTLEERFRRELRRTPRMEIRRRRVERAQRLLLETPYPLTRIARECGFRSSAYCCTVFRALVGLTPLAYRRHSRSD